MKRAALRPWSTRHDFESIQLSDGSLRDSDPHWGDRHGLPDMNEQAPRKPGDPWWRDALLYGAATWVCLLPVVVFLIAGVVMGFVFGNRWLSAKNAALVVYCAQDQVFAEPLLADFTKHTGIRVKPVFDSEAVKTVGLANRLLAERSNPVCDLFWGNEEFRTRQLADAGVFSPDRGWTAFGLRNRRMVVRTHASGEGPLPSSLIEFTNARYRGRISIAFPLFGTTATHLLVLRQRWGESDWLAWCRALVANAPFLEEGNSQVVRRVARGEAWVGLTDSDDIAAGQREGLPVAALPLGPDSLTMPNTVGVVARTGERSVRARRLAAYLQSEAVLEALAVSGALEGRDGVQESSPPDWERILSDRETATAQLKEIFSR